MNFRSLDVILFVGFQGLAAGQTAITEPGVPDEGPSAAGDPGLRVNRQNLSATAPDMGGQPVGCLCRGRDQKRSLREHHLGSR